MCLNCPASRIEFVILNLAAHIEVIRPSERSFAVSCQSDGKVYDLTAIDSRNEGRRIEEKC